MAIIKVRNPAIDLDAAEIPNLDASKITTGSLSADRIPGLAASKITRGTFDDARIAASNVSQHATSFDDNKIVNDISTLALRQASDANRGAYNTNSQSVDVFQDATGIDTTSNTLRNASEYVTSESEITTTSSITLNNSNYTTYIDVNDDDMMSVMKSTSGGANVFDVTATNNNNFHSASDLSPGQIVQNSDEATLLSYVFGSPSASTSYLLDNIDTSNTYRLSYITVAFKSGVTFKPNGTSGFRWRNGSGGMGAFTIYGINTSTNSATQLGERVGSVANGSSYTFPISNSTFFSGFSTRVWHSTSDNQYMFDTLFMPGDVSVITTTLNATGNFTGTTITAPSSVSSMGAIITYQDNAGTNALNTDIVLQLSADGGSNYSTATLTALPDFSTGIKMAKVNDLAVTAGTQLKYKISFANQASGSKEARIRGVALQY